MKVPLIGISRHRLGSDGEGVTTLVTFHGCPLRCKYCLNPQCLHKNGVWRELDEKAVYDNVVIDNLYFLATGGGITFGGGEPCVRSEFIKHFCSLIPEQWNIDVETCLNVERRHLVTLKSLVNHYFIDIKDMNPDIYIRYTGRSNRRVIGNLRWLASQGLADKVTIRLPHIPDYNTPEDVVKSRNILENMGFKDFDEFEYITNIDKYKKL